MERCQYQRIEGERQRKERRGREEKIYLVTGQLPNDDSLVSRRGEDHIGVLRGGGNSRDMTFVADEGS